MSVLTHPEELGSYPNGNLNRLDICALVVRQHSEVAPLADAHNLGAHFLQCRTKKSGKQNRMSHSILET